MVCTLLIAAANAQSKPMPRVEGETLRGHAIAFPAASEGKVAILIFGFTKASKKQTSAWGEELSKDFRNEQNVALYQIPVLEDVPRLIRGMVISSIRKGVPEADRDHFVIVVHGEADLKKLVSYKEEDDAYLVILDRAGNIADQQHGAVNSDASSQLKAKIEALLHTNR